MTSGWWDDDENTTAAATDESQAPARELLDEGEHRLQIQAITDAAERLEISLAPDDRRFGWVFCKLPREASWARRIVRSLAASVAVPADRWQEAISGGDLVGRRVIARVYHKLGRDGRTWVNVAAFKPAPELLAAEAVETASASPQAERAVAQPSARTATQKADKASQMPDDDIPF